jgi:ABC-type multidrug transport system ATPase subunit/pSer/pThr/pTyr-binding forkhead associated (FHA) protein
LVVGREEPADIVLPYPMVSTRHLELRLSKGGLQIRDLGSTNGTFVDGHQVTPRVWVSAGQSLCLGSFKIPPARLSAWLAELQFTPSQVRERLATASVPKDGAIVLGRAPDCDVVVDAAQVSWHHARIISKQGEWTVLDLGSANGTFVNGTRVRRGPLQPQDQLYLGSALVNLDEGRIAVAKSYQGEIRLDALDVTRALDSGQVILDKVGVSIYPGELVALMGPSGAGKTTLLEMLTGQRRPSEGQVLVNGVDLHDNRASLAERIGYVPQEDVMHRDLTVFEVLLHAAVMRLPGDLPRSAVVDHVDKLITRMGIAHIRDNLIGGEAVRGISGGQRKRVNIAIELITEPPLLFLDEPTSGLDSTSTLEVIQVLRALADSGKTIITTIHQPRIEAFERFDKLLLLTKGGRLAFFGPAMPDAGVYFSKRSGLPQPKGGNPSDYVIDALDPLDEVHKRQPQEWQLDYLKSPFYEDYVVKRRGDTDDVVIVPPDRTAVRGQGGAARFANLFTRYLRRKLRDKTSLVIQLLQPLTISLLLGWLFFEEELPSAGEASMMPADLLVANGIHAALFLLATAAFWLGCSNVARELVSERPVFRRERRSGLSLPVYLASVFGLQMLIACIQTFILIALVWLLVDVQSETFLASWGLLLVTAAAGISLGLLVSAASPNEVTAISLVPLLLLPQLMLSGYLKLFREMTDSQEMITNMIPLRWSFEVLAWLEYDASWGSSGPSLTEVIGFPDRSPMLGVAVLSIWTVTCLSLCLHQLFRTPE